MNQDIHASPLEAKPIFTWYKKAQVDYVEQYIKMYIAYNAWYQEVTGSSNDRQALDSLKKRFIIWDDYAQGKTMKPLNLYMERLTELTQREPFSTKTLYWSGSVESPTDWRSLIEFWYQVRCKLVHGSEVRARYVWLAYETLDVFMGEIIDRMQKCFTNEDLKAMKELNTLAATDGSRSERFRQLQNKLYQKYVASPNIWQVDMKRVQ
ncbi:MAG: hypothetical protein ACOH18_02195 [Candidatus Saccharimonadaceae bacterium]